MLLQAVVDRVWQSSVGSRVRVGVVDRGIGHCVKRSDAGGPCEAIASAAIVAMVDRSLKPQTEGISSGVSPSQLPALIARAAKDCYSHQMTVSLPGGSG
jgi:hypothetical protein